MLQGADGKLFAESVWNLISELGASEGDYDIVLDAFDRLTYGQKISLLSAIGTGLLEAVS